MKVSVWHGGRIQFLLIGVECEYVWLLTFKDVLMSLAYQYTLLNTSQNTQYFNAIFFKNQTLVPNNL